MGMVLGLDRLGHSSTKIPQWVSHFDEGIIIQGAWGCLSQADRSTKEENLFARCAGGPRDHHTSRVPRCVCIIPTARAKRRCTEKSLVVRFPLPSLVDHGPSMHALNSQCSCVKHFSDHLEVQCGCPKTAQSLCATAPAQPSPSVLFSTEGTFRLGG